MSKTYLKDFETNLTL